MVIGAGRGHGGRGVAYTLPKQSIGSGHHIIISQSVGMKPAEKIDGWREGIPSATAREKSHEETTKKIPTPRPRDPVCVFVRKHSPPPS